MKRLSVLQPVLGLGILAAMTGFTAPAQATCDSGNYMGAVCFTTSYYCPKHTVEAAGQILPIATHQALYSLLGTTYGGDGRSTFGLPDLRGRSVAGAGDGPGLLPVYRGQKYGQESVTLTEATLPAHSHQWTANDMDFEGTLTVKATTATGTSLTPGGAVPAARPTGGPAGKRKPLYTKQAADSPMASDGVTITLPGTAQTESTGGDPFDGGRVTPLLLRPPQAAMMACVVIEGIFPPRQ